MSAETLRALAANNAAYAPTHTPSPTMRDFPNTKAQIVLTCLDPRCNPHIFWSFGNDNGPAVIRNAGGRANEEALNSMRVLSTIMSYGRNTLGAVAVVHHTDCGMINFDDEFIRRKLKDRVPERAEEIEKLKFGQIKNMEESLREDVAAIRNDPFLPKDVEVLGFEYDIFSGKTREIKV